MAYSIVIPHNNGTAGLTLFVALSNADGTPHATVRDIAVTEIGQGFYRANLSTVPDGYSGTGYLYTTALGGASVWTGSVIVADFGLSPQETENADVKTSTAGGGLDAAGVRAAVGLAAANLDTQFGASPTADENADALLKYDWSGLTGEATHSLLNAGRVVLNRKAPSGANLLVYKEDGTTLALTIALTTSASADKVTAFGDPS